MCCAENESGPLVIFFLPAVVGCLTILLARRWVNSQVTSGSSTAVSRRRKIIKDPLIKRPLPPIACKMLPPGSKKTTGVTKKCVFQGLEEDITNNGKRISRTTRVASPLCPGGASEAKFCDGPVPPKHIPFPQIPQDGELLYETMTFAFTLVATGLQFLNLYRSVWWLPHSYTNQAMKFYLIDPHLVVFIVTILSRRFLLSITMFGVHWFVAPKLWAHAAIGARMFVLGVVLGALSWCTYFIAMKYPLLKLFYLCYPAIVYFLLFGADSSPFLVLDNGRQPLLHCCSHAPTHVRAEVDVLRRDFNLCLKKMLFNSVVGAYYSSFVPCCFAQSYLYYDMYAAAQQVCFVWAALLLRAASQQLSAPYCDTLHRAALHLGRWTREPAGGDSVPWSGERLWARGSRAAHHGAVFASAAPATAAEPDCATHRRFYMVFKNPSSLLCALLCLQLSLILLQLCLLFTVVPWHHFLSILMLLFLNYYTMFKLARDYLVSWKVYKAESMIQEKANLSPVLN